MVKALVKSTANFMLFGDFDLANEDIHRFIPRDVIENAFPRGSTQDTWVGEGNRVSQESNKKFWQNITKHRNNMRNRTMTLGP